MDQKLAHARAFVENAGMRRPMLVDDLEGTLHRAYGCLPNMSFVIDRTGRIVYKANWTDAGSLDLACAQLMVEASARTSGARLAPFEVEWAPKRINERAPFMRGLLENGTTAVHEFVEAVETTHGRPAVRDMEAWMHEQGLTRRPK